MFRDLSTLSIRSASWIGAQCLRKYLSDKEPTNPPIFSLCEYIEELPTESNIPHWDNRGLNLDVNGLGDESLTRFNNDAELKKMVECVREISVSQLYSAWAPKYTKTYLGPAIDMSGVRLTKASFDIFAAHQPMRHGWGDPIELATLDRWRKAV